MKSIIENKPEVFYFALVIGATGVIEGDGIFLEMYFEAGYEWRFISGDKIHKLLMLM